MKNIIVILDPAHGVEVPGKRSPDGKHREYRWSRDRVRELRIALIEKGYEVYLTTTSEEEPGLTKRKNFASAIPGKRKLLISPHNDASGNGSEWMKAHGVSVWTSKGKTDSDICADFILEQFREDFPEIKIRQYSPKHLEKDFEANFTVLMGNYMAVLIEWLFQDNKEDVEKLSDPLINKRFVESLVKAIEKINEYFA